MPASRITRFPLFRRAIFWCVGLCTSVALLYGASWPGGVIAAAPAVQAVGTSVGTLDTVHYIPPVYAVSGLGTTGAHIDHHYLALSTPSTLPVDVTISTKSGVSEVRTISKGNPITVELSAGPFGTLRYGALGIVDDGGLNTVNTTDGLILTAETPFYASIRHRSDSQAESLTAKGQTALGTRFRAGFMRASEVATTSDAIRSHFISVMASQDNTVVSFDNLRAGLVFRGVTGTPAPVTLNRGESYVIGVRFADIAANHRNALNGALITATKPVAMNSGSWMSGGGGEGVSNGQDIGFDQSLPASLVGTEYILAKGLASGVSANVLEVPIVIADSNNTQVFLNGSATPTVTLNAGEYAQISGSHFMGNTMYIRASRPVYVYQSTAGANDVANIGMSLAVALSDAIEPQEVVIGSVNQLGPATMSIIVRAGAPVTLTCSAACLLGAPTAVAGNPAYEIYRRSVNGNVSVTSPEPMFISVITVTGVATSAAYFSGVPNTFAVDDTAVTGLNTPVVIPVMANDNTGAGTFTLTSITNASNGNVVGDVANGTVTYTPDAGFSGEDSFEYTIESGLISSTATVTVTVLPNVYNFTQPAFQLLQPSSATTTNVVTVVREGDLSVGGAISVSLFPGAGTPATPGQDYIDGPIALTFPIGVDTVQVPIALLHDPTNTTDETISLALTGAGVGQTLPTATLTLALVAPNTPPTVTVPSNVIAEATGSSGAAVSFTATGDDAEDGAITPVCSPASDATFALGTTLVSCTATDSDGLTDSATFTVTVMDTTAPGIAPMNDVSVPATSSSGAVVNYAAPSTSDLVDGNGVAVCAPTSGSVFPLGVTPVLCEATDTAGNTASTIFTVTVTNNAPTIYVHHQVFVEATGPGGAEVTFDVVATDIEDGDIPAVCTPASGTMFPLGETTVTCSATDGAGASSGAMSFSVRVQDTTKPVLAPAPDIVAPATSVDGAIVTYDLPAAFDLVDPSPVVTCEPASGTLFAIGTTPVYCTAVDASGNSTGGSSGGSGVKKIPGPAAGKTFTVTVVNNQPTLTVPANQTVEATSEAGAVVTFIVTGDDLEDGELTPDCTPASGDTFPLGTTLVKCRVTDSAGATAGAAFNVTVVDTTPPAIAAMSDVSVSATSASGATVTYTEPATSDLVDGAGTATCSPVSGSTFALGATTVTCTASDGAGNSASSTFTVTVTNNAPTFTAPANQTVEATSGSGATVTFTAMGDDVEDGPVAAVCSPASGSTFPLGTTSVSCTVTDVAGASASGTFTVTVLDVTTTVVTCPSSVTYTGSSIEACTATTTSFGGLNAGAAVTYANNVNAGTATASASFTGDALVVGSSGEATFTITPKALSVNANSYTRSYTASDPMFDGTLTGVVAGDGITATYTSPGAGSQVPGVYPTVPSLHDPLGKLGNYAVSTTNGTLTITNAAPVCTLVPSITSIWQPNHRLVSVTASGATDVDGGPLSYKVIAIFQDEPTNSTGDGNTAIDGFGVGTSTAQVRAERVGGGNGRVYHITYEVTDELGLNCQATVKVGVPHDQGRNSTAVDDGPIYNSTVAGPVTAAAPKGKGKGGE